MNVEYTGRHFEVTPAIRKEVESGLTKIRKILGDKFETKVVLAVEKRRHKAEITISPRNGPIVGLAQAGDIAPVPWRSGTLRARAYQPSHATGRPILLVPGVHARMSVRSSTSARTRSDTPPLVRRPRLTSRTVLPSRAISIARSGVNRLAAPR